MKTITFKYTKADNSTSERTLLALVSPGADFYAGIDVSSIEPEQASEFIKDANELYEDFLGRLKNLQADYDLKHNYRKFLVSGISDLTEI